MEKIWDLHSGYLVPITKELKKEVNKVLLLLKESDSIRGYNPHLKASIMCRYKSLEYELRMVCEHTGVDTVSLWRKIKMYNSDCPAIGIRMLLDKWDKEIAPRLLLGGEGINGKYIPELNQKLIEALNLMELLKTQAGV